MDPSFHVSLFALSDVQQLKFLLSVYDTMKVGKILMLVAISASFIDHVGAKKKSSNEKAYKKIMSEAAKCAREDTSHDDLVNQVIAAAKKRDKASAIAIPGVPGDGTLPMDWFSNILPPSYDKSNAADIDGLPPEVADFGYRKWTGFDLWWLLFIGMDPTTSASSDERNTVFGMNLQDRGPNNLMKKQYMGALTCDKLPLYQAKFDKYIDKFIKDIRKGDKGVMGSWSKRSLELFFDIHLGDKDPPDYVKDYMTTFVDLQSPGTTPYIESKAEDLKRASCLSEDVRNYVDERLDSIIEDDENDTIAFHWLSFGLPKTAILAEIVHNFLAWGQYVNILYRVIRAKLQGYESMEYVDGTLQKFDPIDFFTLLKDAGDDDALRLDVVREAFRLLLPAGDWFSQLEDTDTSSEGSFPVQDDNYNVKTSMHFPMYIQAMGDNYDMQTGMTDVAKYDTSRYENFQASSCPFANTVDVDTFFKMSDIDGETIVPKDQTDFFPVFETYETKYCPFGVGKAWRAVTLSMQLNIMHAMWFVMIHSVLIYCFFLQPFRDRTIQIGHRRCPAEVFNLFMLQNLLDKLDGYEFELEPPDADLFELLDDFNDPLFEDGISLGELSRKTKNLLPNKLYANLCAISFLPRFVF